MYRVARYRRPKRVKPRPVYKRTYKKRYTPIRRKIAYRRVYRRRV